MRNIKFISIFAACGFVLSFVFGLFSHSSFLIILLRAIIFSIIFVILGFLVSFLFKKFLLDSNSLGFESEDANDVQQKSAAEPGKTGQVIDVVVEDEDLPASESDNHFVVGNNAQMLKKTDIGAVQPGDNEGDKSAGNGFTPMGGGEPITQASVQNKQSGTNTVSAESTDPNSNNGTAAVTMENVSDEDLDTLPDMENFTLSDDESIDDNETYTESEFVPSTNMHKKSSSSGPEIKDAALIAKAISTALSEEN